MYAGTSVAGPVVATLFVTALVTAGVSVLITVLVMVFVCKGRGGGHDKGYQTSTSSGKPYMMESNSAYNMESKSVDPPSKPPPVHKPNPTRPAPRPAPPAPRPVPPRPAPRQV